MSDKITIEDLKVLLRTISGDRMAQWRDQPSFYSVATLAIEQHEELTSLRAQLQERDAQLAQDRISCCALASELMNIVAAKPEEWDDPTDFKAWAQNRARYALESLHATAKANAKIIEAAEGLESVYLSSDDELEVEEKVSAVCQAVLEKKALDR